MDEIKLSSEPGGVTVVTIDRPDKRNACNQAMWRGLGDAFRHLAADPATRTVVLTGAGAHFCAGADISEFGDVRADAGAAQAYTADVTHAEQALIDLPKPTIAAVDGFAMGGGCSLSLCCDFRVAGAAARFGIPAARLGIVYAASECEILYRIVGVTNAKRILFLGEQIDAAEAWRIGLVDEVAAGSAMPAALALAGRMAANAPLSLRGAKIALNAIADGTLDAKVGTIDALFAEASNSEDYQEGRRAFLEKRKPAFKGR